MFNLTSGTRQFIRHYAEMLVAMFGGMLVLGLPAEMALGAIGTSTSELRIDAPAVVLLGMAVIMTVPMVAWMRYRGHDWRPCHEMAASMFIPTFGVIALLSGGVVEDFGALMMLEHVVMLPSMLVAMLLRRDEYSCGPRTTRPPEMDGHEHVLYGARSWTTQKPSLPGFMIPAGSSARLIRVSVSCAGPHWRRR